MSNPCRDLGSDGFYHPCSEEDLVFLVKKAFHEGREIRVRGSTHSVARAIYTDVLTDAQNRVLRESPPKVGDNLNVMLDRYRKILRVDEGERLVEVQAGIHLGADPSDPDGAPLSESLLWFLSHKDGEKWMFDNLGGISHQTVSGFSATGSSGGSLTRSFNDNLHSFRVIDGQGQVHEITRGDPRFDAVAVSVGLLGVVSTVTFRCAPAYNIAGQEAIVTYAEAAIDLFGDGSDGRPTLERYLREVEYARLEWWPQRGGERVVIWQAQSIPPTPGFIPRRYQQFTNDPDIAETVMSIFLTIIGNLDTPRRVKPLLEPAMENFVPALEALLRAAGLPNLVSDALAHAAKLGIDAFVEALCLTAPLIKKELPDLFPKVLSLFMQLDSTKKGMEKGEPQSFHDYAWQGLPMDNQASDELLPTEFTEAWIPIQHTQRAMDVLNRYFLEPATAQEALERTGTYAWEIYGAKPTSFWMSPSHSDGSDEWKDGVLRIDAFWFGNNPGNPAEVFYPQLWNLLRENGIPFRLHWGKFQPIVTKDDPQGWTAYFRSQLPKWDDFLKLRAELDPNNVFLNDYWRERFGLWSEPKPRVAPAGVPFERIAEPAPAEG